MITRIVILSVFILTYYSAHAQYISPLSLATASHYSQNGKYNLSYTIGGTMVGIFHNQTSGYSLISGSQANNFMLTTEIINHQVAEKINVSAFPNPTSGRLHITFDNAEPADNYLIKIYDLVGKQINPPIDYRHKLRDEMITLNLDNLNNGLYIIKITSKTKKNKIADLRVIKNY